LTAYYIVILLFCISHSLLVTTRLKEYMYGHISQSNYRLIFNLISLAFLCAIIWAYSGLDHKVLFAFEWQYLLGWIIVLFGATLGYISFKSYNTSEFLGLAKEIVNQHLAVKGMNRYVRHPLYLSTFIMLWGALLIEPTMAYLGFAAILTAYIVVGTKLEEIKLIEVFGQDYRDYKKRVPMFFPWRVRNGVIK
jgi:methanethiol S-methyltransferase